MVWCGMRSVQLYDRYAVPKSHIWHPAWSLSAPLTTWTSIVRLPAASLMAYLSPYGLSCPMSLQLVISCADLCRPVQTISSLSQTSQSCTLTRPSTLQSSKTGWLRPAVSRSVTQYQGFRQWWKLEIRTGYVKASLFMCWVILTMYENYSLPYMTTTSWARHRVPKVVTKEIGKNTSYWTWSRTRFPFFIKNCDKNEEWSHRDFPP